MVARRTRRELEIADHLWDCLTRIAEDCGTDRHAVVNQAIYELARRFQFLTPIAKEVPPLESEVEPPDGGAGGSTQPPPVPKAPAPKGERKRTASEPPPQAPVKFADSKTESANKAELRQQMRDRGAQAKQLYCVNSTGEMHKIDKDTFIIGRSRTCDVVIPSSKVSRQHAGICRENGEYFIEDLGSANGIWREGQKIQKEKVKDGDEFMISEEIIKFIYR